MVASHPQGPPKGPVMQTIVSDRKTEAMWRKAISLAEIEARAKAVVKLGASIPLP